MSTENINKNFYRISASDFSKIPGSPIGYWVSDSMMNAFCNSKLFEEYAYPKQGIATANNDLFLRKWTELKRSDIHIGLKNKTEAKEVHAKWLPYNKGGTFRKWFGNNEYVINWNNDGFAIKNFCDDNGKQRSAIRNSDYFFIPSVTWTDISSSSFGVRCVDAGFLFDGSSHSAFPHILDRELIAGLLCSKPTFEFLKIINPTMHFQVGSVALVPVAISEIKRNKNKIRNLVISLYKLAKIDWDAFETSWDFAKLPLLSRMWIVDSGKQDNVETTDNYSLNTTISSSFNNLRQYWKYITLEMQRLEEKNNRIFIEAYELQGELTSEVLLNEITLTCNPYYRYGNNKSDHELENLLLADSMKELISYAVGCSFGRYSLDKDGLILANSGEGFEDYIKQIRKPTFFPNKNGILPITDENDFTDDLPTQFETFIKASFGDEHFQENLRFVEEAIGKDIRTYFIKDFYKDHAKRYKKRPIYWMISSPSGAFRALIYLHRYTKDTIGLFLNDYLRQYKQKLEAKIKLAEQTIISGSASSSDKTTAQKDIDKIHKVVKELETWERDVVYPLALKRVELDLDDGVKVNYGKLGDVLEVVKGLNG